MIKNWPKVSLIVVTRNEEKFIVNALRSLVEQSYHGELIEIILVDGLSSDNTIKVSEAYLKESGVSYLILNNPRKILATGWNLAIKAAKGEYVCRIDAHGALAKDYIHRGVSIILGEDASDVVSVGGQLVNEGEGFWGEIARDFFSSRFGVGNSPFRIKAAQRFCSDTVAMGVYRKSVFDEVGYFDENLDRNQDIALHKRIMDKGFKFLTDPEMIFFYHVRSSLQSFVKKAYQDGYWIIYSRASYFRHKTPLFFFLYLLLILVMKKLKKLNKLYLLPLKAYIAMSCFFAIKDGIGKSRVILPFMFPIYHLAYGIGSFVALLKFLISCDFYWPFQYVEARNK